MDRSPKASIQIINLRPTARRESKFERLLSKSQEDIQFQLGRETTVLISLHYLMGVSAWKKESLKP
jgi:hypothetical protein